MSIKHLSKYSITIIAGLISAAFIPSVFANAPRYQVVPIGATITLNAGDYATIKVILSTTDPNENGEGELARMWSAGGGEPCSLTVATYNIPAIAKCGPVPANSTMTINSAYLPYFDGDEPGEVIALINNGTNPKKTQAQIDSWEKKAHDDELMSLAIETAQKLCLVGRYLSSWICLYPDAAEQTNLIDKMSGATFSEMAADPPDSDYTEIVQPVTQYFPPVTGPSNVPQNVTDATNAFLANKQIQLGLLRAAVTSFDRASSAWTAGDTDWQTKQILAGAKYSYELGAEMRKEPGLTQALQQAVTNAGISFPVITASDVWSEESSVLYYGLPQDEQALFPALGIDAATAKQLTDITFVQDIYDVANIMTMTNGSNFLLNSTINADLGSASTNLQQFALNNGYVPIDCSKAQPSMAEIWPPNHMMVDENIEGIKDDGDLPFTVSITKIQQDEPLDIDGSGASLIDGSGLGTPMAQVRAERSGGGSGRVYVIGFTATDTSGAACSANVTVTVPHDKAHPAVDTGDRYDSTGQ